VAGHGNASGGERNVIDNYNLAGQASGRPRALTSKAAGGRKLGVRLAVPLSQPPPDSRSRLATRQPRYMSCAAGTDCGERGKRARAAGASAWVALPLPLGASEIFSLGCGLSPDVLSA